LDDIKILMEQLQDHPNLKDYKCKIPNKFADLIIPMLLPKESPSVINTQSLLRGCSRLYSMLMNGILRTCWIRYWF
jgi:hypothetical protein